MTGNGTVVGLDIGGSTTHAMRCDSDGTTREALDGSANIASVGLAGAGAVLGRIAAEIGRGVAAVCAGAAGADTPAACRHLSELLASHFPGARIDVVHDTRMILAAAGLESGAVLIAGTGSAAWGLAPDGQEARAGGWGYLLGDDGGGYSVVRDAVREVLREHDAGLPPGALARALLDATQTGDPLELMDLFYARPERRFWSGLAGIVAGAAGKGDRAAVRILEDAAHALAGLARQIRGRLGDGLELVMAGGLLIHQPALAASVARKLGPAGFHDGPSSGRIRLLDQDPVHGAVRLARATLPERAA